jgi:hypothetical protein
MWYPVEMRNTLIGLALPVFLTACPGQVDPNHPTNDDTSQPADGGETGETERPSGAPAAPSGKQASDPKPVDEKPRPK